MLNIFNKELLTDVSKDISGADRVPAIMPDLNALDNRVAYVVGAFE